MKNNKTRGFSIPAGKGGKTTNAAIPREFFDAELHFWETTKKIEHERYIGERASAYLAPVQRR